MRLDKISVPGTTARKCGTPFIGVSLDKNETEGVRTANCFMNNSMAVSVFQNSS